MTITVVITTWQVPFAQVVRDIKQFEIPADAMSFINDASKEWYDEHNGAKSNLEITDNDFPYTPIKELGYDNAQYHLWGGECGFHAMLDVQSAAILHEAYYKKRFDDQGLTRPGYLINCYVAEGPDGEHAIGEAKHEEYVRQQAAGIAEIEAAYSNPKN